jgi:aminopeptidase N
VSVTEAYNVDNKTYSLTLTQSCLSVDGVTKTEPLHIPIKLGLLAKDGSVATVCINGQAPCDEIIINLKEPQQTFIFEQLDDKPVASLLREFSAPVILKMNQSLEDLAFLLSYDTDTFNRWEAGQKMSALIILDLVSDSQQGRDLQLNPLLVDSFRKILEQPWDDLSYLSLLLTLPEENYLAGQMAVVDVEAIHQAREFVKLGLAEQLKDSFLDLYHRYHQEESGQFDAGAVGRRRIKNSCLGYLNKLESSEGYQLVEKQFSLASTMTDQIAALSIIINSLNPAKASVLQRFYEQWKDEALVIDKWFALQASSHAQETFSIVESLMKHPAFELTTPNRVRSLIGAFSQNNQLHFHAKNGQGYQFLADQVIALNSINPQVASRMVGALTQWKRFDEGRQALMKAALEKIMNTPDISKDVFEVASKSVNY